ncbi:MAG TPA: UDP-N-acetylmuramoyl-L-alanyl-D-glutamate--2,6-diaminopimelate ligase [Acidobacteriota bacterium]|nr:UDP-N-acetylmuramoyl-L-alanyl-D-glutamate--2,6-diaminopimelate ligase [Acidobacteriota bacterium]
MQLKELTSQVREDIVLETIAPGPDGDSPDIASLEYDSRKVGPGALFFAVQGRVADGHRFLDDVVSRGAAAIASERKPPSRFRLPWVKVRQVRRAMALMADRFYGRISERMPLIGITGTNGKTTTLYLIHSILQQRGSALMMGTVEVRFGWEVVEQARLTTPEAIDIQRTLAQGWQAGCHYGAMEVSSHALRLQRAFGCRFPVGVFTNLSRDHLDFHSSYQDYLEAKSLLFDPSYNPAIEWAVLNGEDRRVRGLQLAQGVRRLSFGVGEGKDAGNLDIRLTETPQVSVDGSRMKLDFRGRPLDLRTALAGRHNVYNVLAAAAAASALGFSDQEIAVGVEALKRVPGRFERVEVDHLAHVFVDFAHTPDALKNVLELCRSLARRRVLCIFGCGGDRDRQKRPQMGKHAARLADLAIITSDNPRSEDPQVIVEEIEKGIPEDCSSKVLSIVNRREAIARGLRLAQPEDIVLVAGKGHETYQEINGKRFPFDDREVIREENRS